MKTFFLKLGSGVVISCLSTVVAFASTTHVTKITVDCPDISVRTKDKLTNYGTYIAGIGTERVNSDAPTHPLFQEPIAPGANIPIDLKAAGYDGSHVTYNPANGAVLCHYKSSKGFSAFAVSYIMVNALNGIVVDSGDEQIHIKIPVGLK